MESKRAQNIGIALCCTTAALHDGIQSIKCVLPSA
jgi:hypothetical protein